MSSPYEPPHQGGPGPAGPPQGTGAPAGPGRPAPHPTQPLPPFYRDAQTPPPQGGAGQPQPGGRRGPGWIAVVAIAMVAALCSGTLGGLGGALLAGSDDEPARAEGAITDIAAQTVPSVVTIRVGGSAASGGTGTGWVYDDQGHIVTNNHVVADGGDDIAIQTDAGDRYDAELVGRDVSYDLAVIKVEGADLPPLPVGASKDVVVGDEVVAVGSPLGLSSSVTSGIVSAIERPVTAGEEGEESFISAIQTDAAINPGNSGGPLIDDAGEVVGVNSAIAQLPGGQASGSIGVGFAIPSDVVARTADQLIADGEAEHPAIGVSLDTRWSQEGARVLEDGDADGGQAVLPDGPAAKAGVQPGDVIVEMDGQRITSHDQLIVRIRAKAVGDQVTLTVQRGDQEEELTMTLEPAQEQ